MCRCVGVFGVGSAREPVSVSEAGVQVGGGVGQRK